MRSVAVRQQRSSGEAILHLSSTTQRATEWRVRAQWVDCCRPCICICFCGGGTEGASSASATATATAATVCHGCNLCGERRTAIPAGAAAASAAAAATGSSERQQRHAALSATQPQRASTAASAARAALRVIHAFLRLLTLRHAALTPRCIDALAHLLRLFCILRLPRGAAGAWRQPAAAAEPNPAQEPRGALQQLH